MAAALSAKQIHRTLASLASMLQGFERTKGKHSDCAHKSVKCPLFLSSSVGAWLLQSMAGARSWHAN